MQQKKRLCNGLRNEEDFVAQILTNYFRDQGVVYYEKGEDPPDLYLAFGSERVAVEVTFLPLLTCEKQGNRNSEIAYGIEIIESLDSEFGRLLPNSISAIITVPLPIHVDIRKNFNKKLKQWFSEEAPGLQLSMKKQTELCGVKVCALAIPERPFGKKVVALLPNTNSIVKLELAAKLALHRTIQRKNKKCRHIPHPIWLVVINTNPIIDADLYASVFKKAQIPHGFDRIFLINEGKVKELDA